MTKYQLTLLLCLLVLSLASCNKPNSKEKFLFNTTHCNDPWHEGMTDFSEDLEDVVECFLIEEGITFTRLKLETGNVTAIGCLACSCTGGRQIKLTSQVRFTEELLDLGFELD